MEKTLPFDREKHLYKRDDFEEICKDAMRLFSGTDVLGIEEAKELPAHAVVYAIYSISVIGAYKNFGLTANRLDYHTPVYVGFQIDARLVSTCSPLFSTLPVSTQFDFWRKRIATTKGLSISDFKYRILSFVSAVEALSIGLYLIERHQPIWNRFFSPLAPKTDILRIWNEMHGRHSDVPDDKKQVSRQFYDYLKAVS